MANSNFGVEQVTRYLTLVDRRLYILMHSGVDWKPEYEKELADIDKEISVLRELMETARDFGQGQDNSQCCDDNGSEVARIGETMNLTLTRGQVCDVLRAVTNLKILFGNEVADENISEDRRKIARSSLAMWARLHNEIHQQLIDFDKVKGV